MSFQLSPSVRVTERDLTNIIPAVSSSAAAHAGAFSWGPVMFPVTVSSETELVERFGEPKNDNFQTFFAAANFLSYSANLLLNRVETSGMRNAVASPTGSVSAITIDEEGSGYDSLASPPAVTFSAPDDSDGINAAGTAILSGGEVTGVAVANGGTGYTVATVTFSAPDVSGGTTAEGTATLDAGVITGITVTEGGSGYTSQPTVSITGNGTGFVAGTVSVGPSSITGISVTEEGTGYDSAPTITIEDPESGGTTATATATITTSGVKILNEDHYEANHANGISTVGEVAAKYPGEKGNSIRVSWADSSTFASWAYAGQFDSAPGTSAYVQERGGSNDELHIIVIDAAGEITGTVGQILEKWSYVSKASNAKNLDGTNNYYADVLNSRSSYLWWTGHPTGTNAGGVSTTIFDDFPAFNTLLSGGVTDNAATTGQLMDGFALFADAEKYDVSLIFAGKANTTVATYIINNVAETRRDAVAFVSPQATNGDVIIGDTSEKIDDIIEYRDALPSTSFAVIDSGYKYQYDRYNDVYRYVPLNGDIAGLCARTDFTNDPWWSPGGLNRGQIKNVVKLAVNPNKTQRDKLYPSGVNPVVSFPGEGTVLFGDKTMLARPSAFDRINVRRLFIVLQKAIATAARYQLFEFNDEFTRARFRNMVEPYLRDVQGRRGLTDFRVRCDESNNTPVVIDSNRFVADIYIKPNRSINFITLNFIATPTGVSFDEIGG